MSQSQIFSLGPLTLDQVGERVEQFLRAESGMTVDSVHGPGGYVIQARLQGQDWRKLFGLDKALRVQILPLADATVTVSVGEGKWLDKLGAGAIGAMWFFPLAVAAGVGALGQWKLETDVLDDIRRFIMVAGGPATQPADAPEAAGEAD